MSRTDIVGLTLAEIALVVLFSFVAIFIPAYSRLSRKLRAYHAPDVATLQSALKTAADENEKLKAEIESSRRNLRSAAVPTCAELNKADWLFTAVIRGPDSYEADGVAYSLSELLRRYSSDLSEASEEGCRHRVKLYYGRQVNLADYDYALRRIEQHFYDLKLGEEPQE